MPKSEKEKKTRSVHPNSRKAAQMNKADHKKETKRKRKDDYKTKEKAGWEKILWFKNHLIDGKEKYSAIEASELISWYINRFDERLNEIKNKNATNKELGRHGRAHSAEEDAIKMVNESETDLFINGKFEGPDLTNRANLKSLRELGTDIKEMPRIKLRNFKEQTAVVMDTEVVHSES